jgi:trimeric autotransporter adhesin
MLAAFSGLLMVHLNGLRLSVFATVLFELSLAISPLAPAAQSGEQNPASARPASSRIVQAIDESSLVTLAGNTHPLARAKNDRGPAPDSLPAARMLLVLERSAAQEAALETYLQALQDPTQTAYRQWLTPEEFGERFGVSDADLATIEAWLRSHGFTVARVAASRMAIEFSGTAGQVRSAFHTSIHRYLVDGEPHWANASDPRIPSALAPVVAGLAELNDFVPRAQFVRAPGRTADSAEKQARPDYTFGDSKNGYSIFLGPADAATIYDIPNRYNANLKGAPYDGTGVTIGVAGDSNIDIAQNANYRTTFGLPAKATQVIVDGNDPGENGDAVEAYLDTQVSGGIAPNADVILYTAANTYVSAGLWLAIARALDDNQAEILNVSFGNCESHLGASGNQFVNNLWQQAAAQGISVTVSTGDSGSAGCDNPDTEWEAKDGLAVNGIASTPYDIAVGGTDFDALYNDFPSSFTFYVNIDNNLAYHRSALGHIPEEPWNDSTFQGDNSTIENNLPWAATPYYSLANISAGGGGVSSCARQTGDRCSAGYALPTWQSGIATDTSGRNVPDVSFLAGNGLYGASWGLCTDQDYNSSGSKIVDCAGTPTTGNHFNLTGVGGTSAAAPTFAGILALAVQKAGSRLGQADYMLYKLARSDYYTVFNYINSGNNSVNCVQGSSGCEKTSKGYYYMTGFNAGGGSYSEAAGLGSVDGGLLLKNWSSAGLTSTSSKLTLNGSTAALHLTHGEKVSVEASVSGNNGTPTGDIALVDDISAATQPNSGSIGVFALADGLAKGSKDSLPGGSYSVFAHYSGSATFSASDSKAIPVTVDPEESDTAMTIRGFYDPATLKATTTPHYGFIAVIDAQPYGKNSTLSNPDGPATGTVTFMNGDEAFATVPIASNGIAELQSTTVPAGRYSLTAAYSGDASFKPSASKPQNIEIAPAVTAMTGPENSLDGSAEAGTPVTLYTNLTNLDSDGVAPSGTVTFWNGTEKLGTVPIKGTAGAQGVPASGSVKWTTTRLPAGQLNISAVYNGDANYAASPPSPAVSASILAAESPVVASDYPKTFKVNQPLSVHVKVAPVNGLPVPGGTAYITASGANNPNGYTSPSMKIVDGAATVTVPPNSLLLGGQQLTVEYSGDEYYGGESCIITVDVESSGAVTPTITFSPDGGTISSFPFNLEVKVSGNTGAPVATGNVTLVTQNFTLISPLNGGEAMFSVNFPGGVDDRITAEYAGDSYYTAKTASITIQVQPTKPTPDVVVNPAAGIVVVNQPLTVEIIVVDPPSPTPTGTVYLGCGSFKSPSAPLGGGFAIVTIPADKLPIGSCSLTAFYSGDSRYAPTSNGLGIRVDPSGPAFDLSSSAVTVTRGAVSGNVSIVTVTPLDGFVGQVELSSPNGSCLSSTPTANNELTISIASPVTISNSASQSSTATITTSTSTTPAKYFCGFDGTSGSITLVGFMTIVVE